MQRCDNSFQSSIVDRPTLPEPACYRKGFHQHLPCPQPHNPPTSPSKSPMTLGYDITPHLTPLGSPFLFLRTRWMDDSFHPRNWSMPCIIYICYLGLYEAYVFTHRYKHIWHMIYIDGACLQGRVFTIDPSFQAFQKILIPLHLQLCLCQNSTLNTTWN